MKFRKIKSPTTLLTISMLLSFCFTNAAHAATMPEYERLQPITANLNAPTAITVDDHENIYVVESINNRLLIYSPNCEYLKTLSGLDKPISVAVNTSGRIFIGNAGRGNVEAYNTELNFLYKLGSGDGEFVRPGAIAIDTSNNVYVTDSKEDKVKVYNPDGSYKFSFGTSGSADGQFNFPASITINEVSGEIIISDLQVMQSRRGPYKGARIQIFDMNGSFKRSFGTFGQGDGLLTQPLGVDADKEGRIYITDAYQNVVQVFDNNGIFLGTIYDRNSPMRTPLGIAIGRKTNRIFIASLNSSTVEVYSPDSVVSYPKVEVKNFINGSQLDPDNIPTISLDVRLVDRPGVQFSSTVAFAKGKGTIKILAKKGTLSVTPNRRAWRKIIKIARWNNDIIYLRGFGRNLQNSTVTGMHIMLRVTPPLLAPLSPQNGIEIPDDQPPTFIWTSNSVRRVSIQFLSESGKKVFQAKLKDNVTSFTPTPAVWTKIARKIRKAGGHQGMWYLLSKEVGTRATIESERRRFTVLPSRE